jgi:hypothetical protein
MASPRLIGSVIWVSVAISASCTAAGDEHGVLSPIGSEAGCGTACAAPAAASPPSAGGSSASPALPQGGTGATAAGARGGGPAQDGAQPTADEDAAAPTDAAPEDDGLAADPRPPGVALCYSALSSVHPATEHFWQVFRAGQLDARERVIAELQAARQDHPDEEEFALLLGLASLWRVAEPLPDEALDPLLILDSITTSRSELERAYAICPTDHRITAWLAPIKVRMGRMLGDSALVQEGFDVLERGIEHYPGFVLFSKLLVFADLPADDPDFLNAVEAVRENVGYCGTPATGLSADPACHNHPRAAHNIEGAAVFMGDMYAKAQDPEAARNIYEQAMTTDTWSSWDYQQLMTERLATLDARVAAAATEDTLDDLEPAWASQIQCSICHRD